MRVSRAFLTFCLALTMILPAGITGAQSAGEAARAAADLKAVKAEIAKIAAPMYGG